MYHADECVKSKMAQNLDIQSSVPFVSFYKNTSATLRHLFGLLNCAKIPLHGLEVWVPNPETPP